MNGRPRIGKEEAYNGFGFDWILQAKNDIKSVDVKNFYSENGWDVIFVLRTYEDGSHAYMAGNPFLGGIKTFKNGDRAEDYFFKMVGQIHMDAIIKGVA